MPAEKQSATVQRLIRAFESVQDVSLIAARGDGWLTNDERLLVIDALRAFVPSAIAPGGTQQDDVIESLRVIMQRRGFKIQQGDVLACERAIDFIMRSASEAIKTPALECLEELLAALGCTSVNAALAEVRSLRSATAPAWQPIETAPRDGTDVLLTVIGDDGYGEIDVGSWGFIEKSDWDGSDVIGWLSNYGRIEEPTHWMPLPALPYAADRKVTP